MALVVNDRVQQTGTANTTVSFTLSGSVTGFQSFAVVGNGNTTYYAATDASGNWEVGIGTYSTTGPTLTRTTILSSSNSGSAVTFSGTVNVFVTYPSERSVNLDASGNVTALGTISSGVWNGTTIGVAYGGTGVTTSSGANSVMLRDANQNVAVNRLNQSNTSTTAAGGTTALTAASSYSQTLNGTGTQAYTMPDATTLATGVAFVFNNNATGTLTLKDYAAATIGTITSGGAVELVLLANGTVAGTWDVHGYLPEAVTWGTNALNLGSTVITNGTWNGGTIGTGYGGTGLTTFFAANNAIYSTSSSALTAGTLPIAAGGTGATTASAAFNALSPLTTAGDTLYGGTSGAGTRLAIGTAGQVLTVNSGATAPQWTTPTTGTVTSVTGTAPVVSSGGNTPAISMPAATTSVSGYLTSTDWNTFNGKGSGTVTSVSVVSANGFAGTVATSTTTPAITLTTSITGVLKGNATAISAATSGTDYSAGTSALATGILKSTTTTGALTIAVAADFPTLNQNTTGTAANVTGVVAIANGGTNSTATATAGGVGYGTGTAHAYTAAGTTGQVLTSNGSSAPTWATASSGGATIGLVRAISINCILP